MSGRLLLVRVALVAALAGSACGGSSGDATRSSAVPGCPAQTASASVLRSSAPALVEEPSFGDNPAQLRMFVHAPSNARGARGAVVVALHGCLQDAQDYVAAGWNELAERAGFVVVYPEQVASNDPNRCFRWFDRNQAGPGGGEVRSIAAMVAHAHGVYGAGPTYVTGLSAGGAMAVALLATHPELFEAGAIMSGLPYGCATSIGESLECLEGRDRTADAWGALVPDAARAKPPRVSIWQGAADRTVGPTNLDQLVRQWTRVNGPDEGAATGAPESIGAATHASYVGAGGVVRVESWKISGMGHGVAVDPASGCGVAEGYALDAGVCSSERAAAFFGLVATPSSTGADAGSSGAPTEPAVSPVRGAGTSDAGNCP